MAIVKMKKLQLMVVREQSKELLRDLTRLGCVEITESEELKENESFGSALRSEYGGVVELTAKKNSLSSALNILDRYAPEKKSLLSAKPEIAEAEFLGENELEEELRSASEIEALEAEVRNISGNESRLRSVAESVTPWMALDMPLNMGGTENTTVVLGALPAAVELSEVMQTLAEKVEEAELFEVSSDKDQHYMVLVCLREKTDDALTALRAYSFAQSNLSTLSGTARENNAEALRGIEDCKAKREQYINEIIAKAPCRDAIKLAIDRISTMISTAEAQDRLVGTENVVCMKGWLSTLEESGFLECMQRYDCAYELSDPSPEEYENVPVRLHNNKVTNALNMVTNMYSLPVYGTVDPNPLMAPFFILFYGLMMADMGYGIIMVAAALVALKKIKPKEGALSFCQLLLYGGISTFVMGALTGGFFGNALEQIGKIIGKPEGWGVLPSLFNPMTDSMTVLIGAMVLGIIHLNTGMVINFVEKCKHGDFASAFWEEGALWVTLAGILLVILVGGNVSIAVLVIGCLMVLYGGSRQAKGFGKLTSVFGTLYNQLTGWFGDILSYSRIMALMLAGSVIATVFNTIGAIANNLVFFFVIFIIGHALNFALNLLGCYVHDLRLQCLEYFGKFYQDGGKPFRPVKINTKYYDVIK